MKKRVFAMLYGLCAMVFSLMACGSKSDNGRR